MGGRVFDAKLGRFLQADPFIQFPDNTQSYNRYSYVLNSPLAYTDPSGYLVQELVRVIVDVVGLIEGEFVNPQAWVRLVKDVVDLVDAFQSQSAGNAQVFAPGVGSSAFGSHTGPVQSIAYGNVNEVQQYPWDPTAGQVIGRTYSEMTGGKFANGANTTTFQIFTLGKPVRRVTTKPTFKSDLTKEEKAKLRPRKVNIFDNAVYPSTNNCTQYDVCRMRLEEMAEALLTNPNKGKGEFEILTGRKSVTGYLRDLFPDRTKLGTEALKTTYCQLTNASACSGKNLPQNPYPPRSIVDAIVEPERLHE